MDKTELLKLSKEELADIIISFNDQFNNSKVEFDLGNPVVNYFADVLYEYNTPIMITDAQIDYPGPVIVYINKGFEELTGYKRKELIGVSPRELQGEATERNVLDELRECLLEEKRFYGSVINYKKDGSKFYNQWVMEPFRDIEGEITNYISVHSDLTKIKERELELERTRENLQKHIEQKNNFFSILAHDLKNPLTSFLTLTDIMSKNMNQLSIEKIQKMSDQLFDTANGLAELLSNLLVWSRAQMDEIELEPHMVEVTDLMYNIKRLFRTQLEEKDIKLNVETNDVENIYADPNIINTILRNLISNAIKFSNPGDEIRMKFSKNSTYKIELIDKGIGISNEKIEDIFAFDKRITTLGTNNEKGTGLGLKLSRELANLHEGTLVVESELGKGSKFTLVLPKEIL